jgi:hypothetical protein
MDSAVHPPNVHERVLVPYPLVTLVRAQDIVQLGPLLTVVKVERLGELVELFHRLVLEVRGVFVTELFLPIAEQWCVSVVQERRDETNETYGKEDLPDETCDETFLVPRLRVTVFERRSGVSSPFGDGSEQVPDGGIVASPSVDDELLRTVNSIPSQPA